MCDINGKQRVANFVSMLICRDANILNRFAAVLDSIVILARGARSTGNSLAATVTFLVCRDMFANSEERDEPYLTIFFLMCYRSIFFQSHTSSHSDPLIALFKKSRFSPELPDEGLPIRRLLDLIKYCKTSPLRRELCFSLRFDDDMSWIDDNLCVTLDSLVSARESSNDLLRCYHQVVLYFQKRPRTISINELSKSIDYLNSRVPVNDSHCLVRYILERAAAAQLMLAEVNCDSCWSLGCGDPERIETN
jgi:hypothetical protein